MPTSEAPQDMDLSSATNVWVALSTGSATAAQLRSAQTLEQLYARQTDPALIADEAAPSGNCTATKSGAAVAEALRQAGHRVDVLARELRRRLDEDHGRDPKAIVAVASQVLSSITHLAGVVTIPRQPHQSLSQIEFLPLSDNRVLAVMVVNGRDVQNRVVHLERHYTAEELRRAAVFLNQQFGGKELGQIRADIVAELTQTGATLNQLMLDAIKVAQQMVALPPMAIRSAKRVLQYNMDLDFHRALINESSGLQFARKSPNDQLEQRASFIEKRKPKFTGT